MLASYDNPAMDNIGWMLWWLRHESQSIEIANVSDFLGCERLLACAGVAGY
jgi:hypothetical protein